MYFIVGPAVPQIIFEPCGLCIYTQRGWALLRRNRSTRSSLPFPEHMERPFDFRSMGIPNDLFPKLPSYNPSNPRTLAIELMHEHTRLTIRYVAAAFFALKRADSRTNRMEWKKIADMLVSKLLDQIQDWRTRVGAITAVANYPRERPGVFEMFEAGMNEHIVAAGHFATGVYTGDTRMAEEAAGLLLGKNTDRMSDVLGDITGQRSKTFKAAWTAHVACTAEYVKSALVSYDKFMEDAESCLNISVKVGMMMDDYFDRASFSKNRRRSGSRAGSTIQRESLDNLYGWIE